MNEVINEFIQFINVVQNMRATQTKYFKDRSKSNLMDALSMEGRVDGMSKTLKEKLLQLQQYASEEK